MENNDLEFVHFENEQTTEKFIIYLSTINIMINHRCCSGKGVAVKTNQNYEEITQLINDFWNQIPKETCIIQNKDDICSVCHDNTFNALNCEKPHFICESCFTRVKECPICRRSLNK